MRKVTDITGMKFSSLTVVERAPTPSGRTEAWWTCLCICGKETLASGTSIRNGHKQSCGCLSKEKANPKRVKHGFAGTSEYQTWRNIRARCGNKKTANYVYYGGRGIKVCDSWKESFANFMKDIGPKSDPSFTIERKNNDGNYEPSNCVWAPMSEQSINKRKLGTARVKTKDEDSLSNAGNALVHLLTAERES